MSQDIGNAQSSNLSTAVSDISVASKVTDGATGQEETTYINSDFSKWWGYFNSLPELKSAMLMKGIWVCGKGFTADTETEVILDHISGCGTDTFLDILFNMEVIKRIAGDAFAEIIRDEKTGLLLNLKPLDPSTIRIHANSQGIITKYMQVSKTKDQKEKSFKPEQIFHLCHNRLADQIHGISDIAAIEKTILAENESFEDMKKIMHRQAKPMIIFKLKTDNATKIAAFVTKMDTATNKGENIYVPDDENTLSYEVVQIPISNAVFEWRTDIKNKFYRTMGLPQIVFGSAGTTESGGKIEYLAHEQIFEKDQTFLERQIWQQLFLRIDLLPPTSLLENLQTDQSKDGAMAQMNMQQSDMQAGAGR